MKVAGNTSRGTLECEWVNIFLASSVVEAASRFHSSCLFFASPVTTKTQEVIKGYLKSHTHSVKFSSLGQTIRKAIIGICSSKAFYYVSSEARKVDSKQNIPDLYLPADCGCPVPGLWPGPSCSWPVMSGIVATPAGPSTHCCHLFEENHHAREKINHISSRLLLPPLSFKTRNTKCS